MARLVLPHKTLFVPVPKRQTSVYRLLMALGVALACGLATTAEPEKPASLFDGKSLDGWEGNQKVFRVQDGAIVAGSLQAPLAHNEFLCTTKEYGNFELRLKVRLLGKDANGGIEFRSRRVPNHYEVAGYQADMAEGYWGCLYDESRRNRVLTGPSAAAQKELVKPNDWNEYVIRCEGRRVQMWLNGRRTVDYTEPDESTPRKGIIAVQIHGGPPSEAWYKDIRIRELSGR